ncbi:hypothetical protein IMG5_018140 [Ichthyophthirius multifiliis]|uniref:Casein kinase I n=1 Tax=Ichthyophthirius multifiliis TaxID=5932 RepID=G0QKI0_ICHMU|nr:hypothetical protein IMG5_018140 [Ichthyophthirius multifiliis]EGR34276.1 hypothetical protein IMG5_018140 [Ichthyophthirius multifiliis]|eukprot:XP_004039580.1 hypothetical protein IMG5_018140 [Ichthyophthirius multifiliis]
MTEIGLKIAQKYQVGQQFGQGSFGSIHIATNIETGEVVAVKMEDSKTKHPQLTFEAKIFKVLQGKLGIPTLYYCGQEGQKNVMVIDLLGPSLEDLFNLCQRKLSLKTVLLIVDQLISRIESFHNAGFIHRDIKPDNFLIGLGKKSNLIYIIDYGLGKRYLDSKTKQHIPYRENKNLTGTARYASLSAHLGIEQSRRDDMEAIGYVIVYLLKGSLPWQGIKAQNKQEKYNKIMEKKMQTPIEILAKGLPIEFSTYMNYCRSLRFDDKIDYLHLRKMFKELFYRNKYDWDYAYDWTLPIDNQPKSSWKNNKITINVNSQPVLNELNNQYQEIGDDGAPITLRLNQDIQDKGQAQLYKSEYVNQNNNQGLKSNYLQKLDKNMEENINDSNLPQLNEIKQNSYKAVEFQQEEIYSTAQKDNNYENYNYNYDPYDAISNVQQIPNNLLNFSNQNNLPYQGDDITPDAFKPTPQYIDENMNNYGETDNNYSHIQDYRN